MARIIRNSNTDMLSRFLKTSMISSILTFIVGLIIYFFADTLINLIGIFTGVVLIFSGVNTLLKYLKRDGAKLYKYNIVFSIIMFVLGVLVLFAPSSIASFIMVILGFYFITLGANKITYASWIKVGGDQSWLITMVIGIFIAFLGILIMANPFEATLTAAEVIGVFFMLSGVLDFTNTLLLKGRKEEINNIFW